MNEGKLILPHDYENKLDYVSTEIAIKYVKDLFERRLAYHLNLMRVSAPLFVRKDSGLNDNLNGVERPVTFDIRDIEGDVEIVHSLAKWKRMALKRYGFEVNKGIYTDMNAIRRDEIVDNLHSVYVDQWDWEKIISAENRTLDHLQETVKKIMKALKETEQQLCKVFENLEPFIKEEITFITSQELEDRYPHLTPKEREYEFTKLHGSACIMQIGDKLENGEPHDGRAPDYDDWALNADILVYYPVLDIALELSSMGIRVDKEALLSQLEKAGCPERAELPFQKAILNEELPYTIGGGIGQSRICMFFLRKAHIGEVQCSIWPEEIRKEAEAHGIQLL